MKDQLDITNTMVTRHNR